MHLNHALLISIFLTLVHTQVTVVNTIITFTAPVIPGHTVAGVTNGPVTIQPITFTGTTAAPVTLSGKATIGYGVTVIAQSSEVYVFGSNGDDIGGIDGTQILGSVTVISGTLIAPGGATATTVDAVTTEGSNESSISGANSEPTGTSAGNSQTAKGTTSSAASASKTSDSGSVRNIAGVGALGLAVVGAIGAVGL